MKYHPRQLMRVTRSRIHRFWHLSRADVFAVAGSCGKTSATHFLGKILSDCAPCFVGVNENTRKATLKNLAKTRTRYRFFVQEAGVTQPGDMARNISLLRPNIGIVTTIGQDHYTSFRTLDATAAEKGVLIESLPNSGTAVLNADDPHVSACDNEPGRGC
jgi:UDP-N-acetylmuramoyl-tripeptide--D-alanyl-D-alanine ligase